jgi:hypothetical protein
MKEEIKKDMETLKNNQSEINNSIFQVNRLNRNLCEQRGAS